MRQVFLALSILLLGLTWAMAQEPSSQSNSGSGQTGGSYSGQSGSTTSGQNGSDNGQMRSGSGHANVEGCLSGSDGNFTLTDKNGMTYHLTGDTAKLSEHVGHEVKVMGSTGGGDSGSASNSSGAGQTLQVSSVKHISKTCKSGGQMSH